MNYPKIIALLSLTVLSAGLKCRNEDPPPAFPPVTQTGAGTIACKVDGNEWVAHLNFLGGGRPPKAIFIGGRLNINASRPMDSGGQKFYLMLDSVGTTGRYLTSFGSNPLPHIAGRYSPGGSSRSTFVTDSLHRGHITISRLDTAARIVAGTYEFEVGTSVTTDSGTVVAGPVTHQVTEGRFDLTFD